MTAAVALASQNGFLRLAVDTILRQAGLDVRLEACRSFAAAARLAAETPLDLVLLDDGLDPRDRACPKAGGPGMPVLMLLTGGAPPGMPLPGARPVPACHEGRLDIGVLRRSLPGAVAAALRGGRPAAAVPRRAREPADLLLIGASTGGPEALLAFLGALAAPRCPAVIAIHMPQDQTAAFARHLSGRSGRPVVEIAAGALPAPGGLGLIRGGANVRVERSANGPRLARSLDEAGPYRPSVDLLFASAAAAGYRCDAVVLSGMGRDGALGAARIEAAGGRVFVQAPASCVVAGMPEATLAACGWAEALAPALIAGRLGAAGVGP